jgi:hypothetical protein
MMPDSKKLVVTIERHMVEQQKLHAAASGQFTSMLW